jgi:cardiolipin synthase
MKDRGSILNVPNILSAYRILAIPVILWAILSGWRALFAVLILVSLLTDILDGLIARLCHKETELGAKLDSFADIGTSVLAMLGMVLLERAFVATHLLEWSLIVVCYLIPQLVSVIRFGRPTSMHLYSSKITGYAQGIFFVSYFFFHYIPVMFYAMFTMTLLNNIEELVVLIILRESRSNARGLYWVLKSLKRRS